MNTYKFFPTNPDLCLFQDIRPLKLDVNMNDILQFVLVLIFYERQVFSEFSLQILNGWSFDIYFDFPYDFKTTDWLDWLKFLHKLTKCLWLMIKRAKYLNFQQKCHCSQTNASSWFGNNLTAIFSIQGNKTLKVNKCTWILITQRFKTPHRSIESLLTTSQHNFSSKYTYLGHIC